MVIFSTSQASSAPKNNHMPTKPLGLVGNPLPFVGGIVMVPKTIPELINSMEATAKQCRVTVQAICDQARIDRSTWRHWKTGLAKPRATNWQAVKAALATLIEASDPGPTERVQ